MKTLGYVYAFSCGNTIGAALGLLLAPEKGTNTRSKISDAVDSFYRKYDIKLSHREAKDFVEDIKDAVSDTI